MKKNNAISLIENYFFYFGEQINFMLREFSDEECVNLAHAFIDIVEDSSDKDLIHPDAVMKNETIHITLRPYLLILAHFYNMDVTSYSLMLSYIDIFKKRPAMDEEKLNELYNLCKESFDDIVETEE